MNDTAKKVVSINPSRDAQVREVQAELDCIMDMFALCKLGVTDMQARLAVLKEKYKDLGEGLIRAVVLAAFLGLALMGGAQAQRAEVCHSCPRNLHGQLDNTPKEAKKPEVAHMEGKYKKVKKPKKVKAPKIEKGPGAPAAAVGR